MEISFDRINSEIEKSSKTILLKTSDFKRQLNSTIYFVANKKLNHWSISKEIACYVFNIANVVDAKTFFYDNGFIDALSLEDIELEKFVKTKFLNWAKSFTNTVDIYSKLKKDREESNRIQLLIPIESLKGISINSNSTAPNFDVAIEGKEKFIKEYRYNSRHQKLIKAAKLKWKTNCWVCGFNFTDMYGDLGLDFIEIHHLIPISEGERESKIEDVRPVCSNCHRMIHKRSKMLTIQELKNIIEVVKHNKASK